MSKEPRNTNLDKTDHVRRKLLKGAGAASAASALSVPLILCRHAPMRRPN